MKTINKLTLLFIVSLFITGCFSTAYKQGNWFNNNSDRDWDIDSAVCLQKSEKLDTNDLKRISEIELEQQNIQLTHSSIEDSNKSYNSSSDASTAISVFTTLGTVFSKIKEVTAEDQVKEEKFENCLKRKSWFVK